MKSRRLTGNAGFTLLEVMICVAMLATTFAAATGFVVAAWRSTESNEDRVFAVQKAISMLAEVRSFLETPVEDTDPQGNPITRAKTIVDLDSLDDGVVTNPILTIDDGVTDPGHPLSMNQRMTGDRYDTTTGGQTAWWKYERQVSVRPLYEQGVVVSRDVRIVLVKIFGYRKDGARASLAEVGTILRTTAEAYPTTQVYDVYVLAVDTIPGWWVYMSYVKPFIDAVIKDLENRNPGLDLREHWITKAGYGRDPEYTPYFNLVTDSEQAVDRVYWYPGTMPDIVTSTNKPRDVDKYYSPERVDARINVDEALENDADATENPFPYAVADQWNHSLRYAENREYYEQRGGRNVEGDPPYSLLLDEMSLHPDEYLNAIVINIHGELMPVPPVHNSADPAKDPKDHPGWRVVTHPEQIWYDSLPAGGTAAWDDENDPEAYITLRVYGYVHPGQDTANGGAPYPMADDTATTDPNKQGYYTTDPNGHPNTKLPVEGIEYMPGNDANTDGGGNNVINDNIPITVAVELMDPDGNYVPLDLTAAGPAPYPWGNNVPVKVFRIDGGFDFTMNPNYPDPPAADPRVDPATYGNPDGSQDDYFISECPQEPDDNPDYPGQMYWRFAPANYAGGQPANPGLTPHRNMFGAARNASVFELYNTPLYSPQVCPENGGPPSFRGLLNERDPAGAGAKWHLYEMEYIPCSPDTAADRNYASANLPCYYTAAGAKVQSPNFPASLKTGFARNLAWAPSTPDVIAANTGAKPRVYMNGGDGTSWTGSDAFNQNRARRDMVLADIDGDGDTDFVVANTSNQTNRVVLNDGDGTWTRQDISGDAERSWGIAVGDLNVDGCLDVVIGNDNNSSQPNRVYLGVFSDDNSSGLFEGGFDTWMGFAPLSNPLATPGELGVNDTQTDETYAVAIVDLNGDKVPDIITGNYGQPNKYYLGTWIDGNGGNPVDGICQPGEWTGLTAAGVAFPDGNSNTYDIAVGDIDKDGVMDVATADAGQKDNVFLGAWVDGQGGNPVDGICQPGEWNGFTWIELNWGNSRGAALGDLNGDGVLDVVYGKWNQTNVYYLSQWTDGNGNGVCDAGEWTGFGGRTDIGSDTHNTHDVALADMDADGDLDLVVGNVSTNYVYFNDGAAGGWGSAQITGDSQETYAIGVAELGVDDLPKNTARWIIQIPKKAVQNALATAGVGEGAVRVTTRIGKDLTTGVFWPLQADPGQDITGRNKPADVSRTTTWFVNEPTHVPFSERYQFQGDPRHCPYVDLRYSNPLDTAVTPFADGYNWYFCDFSDGDGSAVTEWGEGFEDGRMRDGWSGNNCEFDVPRYFFWFRSAIIESRCLFTTLTGFSFYYMCMGGEAGYDAANGPSFANGVPINKMVWDGTDVPTAESQLNNSGSSGNGKGAKIIGANYAMGGDQWWAKPWLGELYPDHLYTTYWRWPEDGEPAATELKGNLPTKKKDSAYPFEWVTRGYICQNGSAWCGDGRPLGTTFAFSVRRTQTQGCTTMFNCEMSPGKVFRHYFRSYGSLGSLHPPGQQLADRYYFPVPTDTKISRPFSIETGYSKPDNWNYYPYTERNEAEIPYRMGQEQMFYDHSNNPAWEKGSAIVRTMAPAIDYDGNGVTDNLEKCGYIVVNGIDKTTETGTAFIGKYSLLTLIHSFLAAGHPNLDDGTVSYRITQLPRVEIKTPTLETELDDPAGAEPVQWNITWLRWDQQKYTDEYPNGFSEDETKLKYVVMYSKDNADTWQYMSDDTNVLPPDGPGLGYHYNDPHLMADAVVGDEVFMWDLGDATKFPEGSYLIRVECYREGAPLHYSYHMEKIFISR